MTHIFDIPFSKLKADQTYRSGFLILNLLGEPDQVLLMIDLLNQNMRLPLYKATRAMLSDTSIQVIKTYGSYTYTKNNVTHLQVGHVGHVVREFDSQIYGCFEHGILQIVLQNWSTSEPQYNRSDLDQSLKEIVDRYSLKFWTLEWEHPNWDYGNELFAFGEDAQSLNDLIKG